MNCETGIPKIVLLVTWVTCQCQYIDSLNGNFNSSGRRGHIPAPALTARGPRGLDPGRDPVQRDVAVASAVHDRPAEDFAGRSADLEGQDRFDQHHDRCIAGRNAVRLL